MTINELLKENLNVEFKDIDSEIFEEIDRVIEEENILFELEASDTVGLSKKYKNLRRKHSYDYRKFANTEYREGNSKFKKGREGLVTRISNLLNKAGKSVSRSIIRSYLYKKYKQWKNESPNYTDKKGKACFIKPIEIGSRKNGFDPQKYRDSNPTDKSVYKTEYDGRGYFFKSFCNNVVKDLIDKENKKPENKGKFRTSEAERKRKQRKNKR